MTPFAAQAHRPARRLARCTRRPVGPTRFDRRGTGPVAGARPRRSQGSAGTARDRQRPRDAGRYAAAGSGSTGGTPRGGDRTGPARTRRRLDVPRARIASLAAYDDPATPEIIIGQYANFTDFERADAIATLAARPAWALTLLEAIERGRIPRRDLSVSVARHLLAFPDPRVRPRLETVWGTLQPTSKAKAALVGKYKALLNSTQDRPADPVQGRAVFNRACLACHKLFDAGGNVGPELTGSDRANPDYILENVLDPSASVSRDYTVTNVATTDGRMVSGIIREQTPTSLVVQTPNERVVLPRDEVEAIQPTATSMMPEGLLELLSTREIRDLFAYLASTKQLPLAPDTKN